MSHPKILVTGAAGQTGSAVARRMLAAGYPVRALVRRVDARSDALQAQGAEIVVADMGDPEAMFAALKPGGIYFVEDHSAPGTGLTATRTLHRIDPMAVVSQVTAAGFVLEATSDLVANPDDPHTANPRDVTPTSDKFAFRFRRPR